MALNRTESQQATRIDKKMQNERIQESKLILGEQADLFLERTKLLCTALKRIRSEEQHRLIVELQQMNNQLSNILDRLAATDYFPEDDSSPPFAVDLIRGVGTFRGPIPEPEGERGRRQ